MPQAMLLALLRQFYAAALPKSLLFKFVDVELHHYVGKPHMEMNQT